MEGLDLFSSLPEGCISHIISFTSPRDACRSSAVCSIFRSASESDMVWERFLPPDYPDVLAGSVSPPVRFSSKKELFFRLCDPVLIDDNRMSFSIEKTTGRKCYMLSARKLWITWGDTPRYWKWNSLPESRFPEAAELLGVCWLEISGKIDAHLLSPKTTYKAYLVIKFREEAYGLDYPAETSIKLGDHASNNEVILQQNGTWRFQSWTALDQLNMWRSAQLVSNRGDGQVPQARSDGWMEIEMGEFFNDEGEEGDIEMILMEVNSGHWKSGLIVEGIEMRPVYN
ncbi:hypothetical protein MRB53_035479 [Persea americana]|uniref:Uncharacterized protein n=1 Tax=Persea americana TaxID=3435 RepID=A0ACC2K4S9_PERAE|nr:hypothetical protein MRB53_035479 [Persea americana]